MAGMRDPLTEEPPPSRFDPEELNIFEPTDVIDLTPPSVEWAPSVVEKLQSGQLRPQLLIVALSKVGINLIHNLSKKTIIGNIVLPGTSMPKTTSDPGAKDKACYLFSCEPDLAIVLVSVQYMVPVERSSVWTKFLFKLFAAERVLVLEHTPIRHFRGKLSVDEPMLFVLNTDQQKLEDEKSAPVAPYYPSGSLVDGLAAALLTHCQLRGLKGRLLLTWPEDDSGLVKMLVAILSNILKVVPQGANVDFVEAGEKMVAMWKLAMENYCNCGLRSLQLLEYLMCMRSVAIQPGQNLQLPILSRPS
ncbi:unnamed protein product [Calypogeia fissa]